MDIYLLLRQKRAAKSWASKKDLRKVYMCTEKELTELALKQDGLEEKIEDLLYIIGNRSYKVITCKTNINTIDRFSPLFLILSEL